MQNVILSKIEVQLTNSDNSSLPFRMEMSEQPRNVSCGPHPRSKEYKNYNWKKNRKFMHLLWVPSGQGPQSFPETNKNVMEKYINSFAWD